MKKLIYIISLFLIISCSQKSEPAAQNEVTEAYTIISDKKYHSYKRDIEVYIEKRLNEQDISKIANKIKNSSDQKFERTFISYRLRGESTDLYWARTDFSPNLKVSFLRAPNRDQIILMETSVKGEKIASWIDDGGYAIKKLILYRRGKQIFIDTFYLDGSSETSEYKEKNISGETHITPIDSNSNKEYKVITKENTLKFFDKDGVYFSLNPSH
uniref:hypothetical protein n=1 Tax=Polaromonas sp. TaxID=1869339 RepID=UPI001598873F|nr:hypothetical protein [Polaromonas sp.]QJS06515.1 hypothetical protein [Polaromonas sp.]